MPDRVVFFAGPAEALEGPYFGVLELLPEAIELGGEEGSVTVPREALRSASLLRKNGQAVSIRLRTADGNEVSFGVLRFRMGRGLVLNHYLRTAELFRELRRWAGIPDEDPSAPTQPPSGEPAATEKPADAT